MWKEIPEGVLLRKICGSNTICLLFSSVWDNAKMQKDFFFYPTSELAEDTIFSMNIDKTRVDSP